jgi:predicted nucleotidyltransferase
VRIPVGMREDGSLAMYYTVLVGNMHLTGDLKLIADQVGEWAQLQEPIVRLWFLGSRARQTHSPDNDLDIAFEIESLPSTEAKESFQVLHDLWTAELSEATGLEIHFEPIAVEQIQAAVTDHGVLIYERVAAAPCRWLA